MPSSTPDPLSQAAELLRSNQRGEARRLLAAFLKENPTSAKGWWLMSHAVDDPNQQVSCLKRVLRLHPTHDKAKARLAQLTGETPPKPKLEQKKAAFSLPAILAIAVFSCLGFITIGYFGYQVFFPSSSAPPTQVAVAQSPEETATLISTASLPPTWTNTPTVEPSATPTASPVQASATPLISSTPTIDPNATSTPIPDNLVGTGNGQYPPDFILENAITGEEISLRTYTNEHPVIVVFLTTWCTYCGQEMPGLQAVYEKYQDQGLVVLGIGIGASKSALRTYASRYGLTFPLLSDWEQDIAREYGASSIPMNYVIRKNGKIWQVNVGMLSADELDITVASVLKVP